MLSLSPAKLLVVLLVALIVLGPQKLPQVARQLGAFWGDLRRWRDRLESEVRSTFPDLPSTHEVVEAVRSPLSFLDRLADSHDTTSSNGGPAPLAAGKSAESDAPRPSGSDPPSAAPGGGQDGAEARQAVGSNGAAQGAPNGTARRETNGASAPSRSFGPDAVTAGDGAAWNHDDPSMN
ncbi:MAG: Sec-independent protein translocase subunit TatA/TatB [Acidimicrobiales bacterium]